MEAQLGCARDAMGYLSRTDNAIFEKGRRSLDNTAIIFPSVATLDDPHVYRVTSILHDNVDPVLLQQSLNDILPYFEAFCVRMTRDTYWRRFEKSHALPAIKRDKGDFCRHFDQAHGGQPLFRTLYSGNSIHLEVFHSLTDGIGAMRFLKALTYRYCQLAYSHELHRDHCFSLFGLEHAATLVDGYAYSHQFPKEECISKVETEKTSYQLKGDLLASGLSRVQTEKIPVEVLKSSSKRHGVTLGVYLTAAIAYAIHEDFGIPRGETIGICVPVNLRPIFKIDTSLNFFSTVIVQVPHHCLCSFESALLETQRQFSLKTTKERLQKSISDTVRMENSRLAQMVPLGIKDPVLKLVYQHIKKRRTTTFSNLGNLSVKEAFKPFFKGFSAVGSTSSNEPVRLAACSYNGELSLSCISKLKNDDIMGRLLKRLWDS